MKRGFTLIELVFVIVVLGIISMFGADLYTKIYKSYVHVRAVNQLEARTQNAMMLITNRLEDRIKSSTIGRELQTNEFCTDQRSYRSEIRHTRVDRTKRRD